MKLSLSDELIEQETYKDGSKTIRRCKYVGENLISDRVAELEQELAECKSNIPIYNSIKELCKETCKENERLKADLNKMTQSYQAGLLVRDELKAQVQERGERMELFRKFLINRSVDEEGFVLLWWTIFWRGHKECEDWFDEGKAI